jgi:catechol 2,3-dioxygenase-like lactoylglutathione lyase family enzyme
MSDAKVNVRYMVDDVDAAIAWYTTHLGFTLLSSAAPAFADVTRGSLQLLLSGKTSSAGRAMADGAQPTPGGWNRIQLVFDDLAAELARLKEGGLHFRNDIVTGPGGSQVLLLAWIIHRMPGIRWRMSRKVLITLMDWVSTPTTHASTLRHIRHVREYRRAVRLSSGLPQKGHRGIRRWSADFGCRGVVAGADRAAAWRG